MFRTQHRYFNRINLEIGLKIFQQLDDAALQKAARTALDIWRGIIEDAPQLRAMLWIGDGDEVFNWSGKMADTFAWNDTIGFNNLKYNAYPENQHYRTWYARPFMANPPKFTYADLKRVVDTLKATAREMFGREMAVGTTIDAGPEFVESPFKFERHPELLKGGPNSEFPKSLSFLCCYAKLKGDNYSYAAFPNGLPEGTPFGTFLGKQFQSLADAVGFDFVWFSNGFGLTHYAWNFLGEVFDGREFRPDLAPENIRNFVSFWQAFRAACPTRPILIRGTNFSIGMDAATHGIDIRDIYREGQLEVPAPNPPWGSSNLGLEMAAHLSRMSSTPARNILFRFYINDSWFAVVPWYEYYNRETFDIYCPMSAARLTAAGAAETPTDFNCMTVNTGYGELLKDQALEVVPHIRRAFDIAPDEAGPVVWVYPFAEYQDQLHRSDACLQKPFFGDWYIARAIAAGLPLNTVINTDNLAPCLLDNPAALQGRILLTPTPAATWTYAQTVLDFVKAGGQAIFYGSLRDASPALLKALNIKHDAPIEGDLDLTLKMETDTFETKPPKRPLRHIAKDSDGGITEILANKTDKSTTVRAAVTQSSQRRIYALVRQERSWKGGKIAWVRGSLPFAAAPNSLEPILFKADEVHDAPTFLRYLLTDFGYDLRQTRHAVTTAAACLFASRSRGAWFFSGHKPDATARVRLQFPDGAPLLCERQALIQDNATWYYLDRSFNFECQAFVKQAGESLVSHKENRTEPHQIRAFTISGLQEAVLTLYVPRQALAEKRLRIRAVIPYVIQDPSVTEGAGKGKKKGGGGTRDLQWKVDPRTGAVVIEKTSGTVSVEY